MVLSPIQPETVVFKLPTEDNSFMAFRRKIDEAFSNTEGGFIAFKERLFAITDSQEIPVLKAYLDDLEMRMLLIDVIIAERKSDGTESN